MSAAPTEGLRSQQNNAFVLASSSPRRSELLRSVGVDPLVIVAAIDETPMADESARSLVSRLSEAKALAGARQVMADWPADLCRVAGARVPVLGADTVIELDGEILGKPRNAEDAERMLGALSNRTHAVLTGVAIVILGVDEHGGETIVERRSAVATTAVDFGPLTAADIEAYIVSGEYQGKAGAYAIQGRGGLFVRSIQGTNDNVVGLPLGIVDAVLAESGLRLRDFAS